MIKKQDNETRNNGAPELTREEAHAKRKKILAQAAQERRHDGPSSAQIDEADSTLATLILPGG